MSASFSATVGDLTHASSVGEISEIALSAARRFTGSDGATLIFREGDFCHYVDERAIGPLWKGARFPMSACISGWVMMHRERAIIPDIANDPRIPLDAYRPTFVKSLCMTPIGKTEPRAAIGAYWQEAHVVSEDQCFLLSILAEAVEVALKRVHGAEGLRAAIAKVSHHREVREAVSRAHEAFVAVNSQESAVEAGRRLLELGAFLTELVPMSGAYFTSFDLLESVVSELQDRSGFRIEYQASPVLVTAEKTRTNALMSRLAALFEGHAANRIFVGLDHARKGSLSFIGPQLRKDPDTNFLMEIACYIGAHDGDFILDFYEGSFIRVRLTLPAAKDFTARIEEVS